MSRAGGRRLTQSVDAAARTGNSPHTETDTHTRELILIVSNVGPSSVGLVHTWDPIELC